MKEVSATTSTPLNEEEVDLGSKSEDELDESDLEAVAGGVTWHPDQERSGGERWGNAKDT